MKDLPGTGDVADLVAVLEEAGHRATASRRAVAELIASRDGAFETAEAGNGDGSLAAGRKTRRQRIRHILRAHHADQPLHNLNHLLLI